MNGPRNEKKLINNQITKTDTQSTFIVNDVILTNVSSLFFKFTIEPIPQENTAV